MEDREVPSSLTHAAVGPLAHHLGDTHVALLLRPPLTVWRGEWGSDELAGPDLAARSRTQPELRTDSVLYIVSLAA